MKLIIDIDDEQVLFDIKNRGLEGETETDKVIINALYNGTPLDEVIGEIADIPAFDYDTPKVRTRALEILDNIGKESEE